MTHITAAFQQLSFRGRSDTVGLNVNTFTHALNTNWTQQTGQKFRVRFCIQETAGGVLSEGFRVRYSLNGGTFTELTTTTLVQIVASDQFTNGDSTSKLLNGTGTFVAGFGESDNNITPNISFTANSNTEIEICLQIDAA